MRPLATATLVICSLTTAAAHGPLDGAWALDLADCAEDRPPTDIVPMIIDGNVIDYYESRCILMDPEQIGQSGHMWRGRLSCTGEGETWDGGEVIFALEGILDGIARRLIEFDLESGTATVHENCNAPIE